MPTLLLTRSEVAASLDPAALVPALRDAFLAYSTGAGERARRQPGARPPREQHGALPGHGPRRARLHRQGAREVPGAAARHPGGPAVAASAEAAVADAEIVLSAAWAREPFLRAGMLPPSAHVTTLGPDEPGKAEVAAEVIRAGAFFCDDRALAVEMGALGGVGLAFHDAVAAWAAYVEARRAGRGRGIEFLA